MFLNVKKIEKAEKQIAKEERRIYKAERHVDKAERRIEKAERKLLKKHPRVGNILYGAPVNGAPIPSPLHPPPPPQAMAMPPLTPPRSLTPPPLPLTQPVGMAYGGGYGQPPSYASVMGPSGGAGSGRHAGGPFLYPPGVPNPHANLYGPMAIFKPYDRDGDGMITENDFIIAMRENGMGYIGDEMAREAFRKFDKNRNGRLDMHEAVKALKYLRPGYY